MILIDWSNIGISAIMAVTYKKPIEEDLIRHSLINSLREIVFKFSRKYGKDNIVLCTDNGSSWRKKIFEHYKYKRKEDRAKDKERWDTIYEIFNKITDEIRDNFPYKIVGIQHMEADDIIGTLSMSYGNTIPIIIVSNDKDFIQLYSKNIKIWSPMKDAYIKESNPDKYLYEHILRGDKGDGIPNFLSDDDCFVTGTRQTSIKKEKLSEWLKSVPENVFDKEQMKNYNRNKSLIDLTMIPEQYQKNILKEYEEVSKQEKPPRQGFKIMSYLAENDLNQLLERVDEF